MSENENIRLCSVDDLAAWLPEDLFMALKCCGGMPGSAVGELFSSPGPRQLLTAMRPSVPGGSNYKVSIGFVLRVFEDRLPDNWEASPEEWRLRGV